MARSEKVANPKNVVLGSEPDATKIQAGAGNYTVDFITAMNWYSLDGSKADARKYIREYIKKNMPSELIDFDRVKDSDIRVTYGWVARLLNRGAKLSDHHVSKFIDHIKELLQPLRKEVEQNIVINSNRPSIQTAMNEKITNYIGNLEGHYDEYITNGTEFSLENDIKAKEIPQPYVAKIQEWARYKLLEWIEIAEGKDSQLNEAYSHYSKKSKKDVAKFFADMIQACEKYDAFKKANRKPRVIKPKTPAQQVKSLRFKTKDDDLGLSSVHPTEIVGANSVWLYNTKTRKLMVYRTESSQGIQIKGSSLQNYEPELSEQKTLRKPQEQLNALLNAGKVQLRKFMDTINSKKQEVNGRLNTEVIILRVVK